MADDTFVQTQSYDGLPPVPGLGMRHAWDVFGRQDVLGSVNRLGAEQVLRGLREVRDGEVVGLDLPVGFVDPPLFSRPPVQHTIIPVSRNEYEDRLDDFNLQASSQWDGLSHVRCREFGFWGGRTAAPTSESDLGVHRWAEHGIVGRGVLLDVAAMAEEEGEPVDGASNTAITADDLRRAARRQGVEIEPGDVLCIRTGWLSWYRAATAEQRAEVARTPRSPGLEGTESIARLLWGWQVSAVATDNPAVERVPGDPGEGSLHRRLIPLLGMALGELFDLDRLARAVRSDGRAAFLFVSVPMNLPGGIASPANAVAIR
jgi:kynurenine formamidase